MNPLDQIRFVLINTNHPGNIGAAARALKTMGLSQLVLVEPKDFPADEAVWRAAGGKDVLANAKVVGSLDEAIEDCTLIYATSARQRYIPWPLQPARDAAESMITHARQPEANVAIVFGREDRGLTNEELQRCNAHLTIPGNTEYGVLNIAAAVQVVAYELHVASLEEAFVEEWDVPPASLQAVEQLNDKLMEAMEAVGFYRPDTPKQMPTRIKRLLMRSNMDQMEVNMLRGFLKLLMRKLGDK